MRLSNLLYYKSPIPTSYLPKRKSSGPMFENPEVNKLVDAHHEVIKEKGYEKLVIPKELHLVDLDSMLSENDKFVAETLRKNGFKSYLCGGTARDLALHEWVSDFDFVTDAGNDDLKRIFDDIKFHAIPSGHEFGYLDFGDEIVDVCTMVNIPSELQGIEYVPDIGSDSLYSDNLLYDAFQRDLKINTLYMDTDTGELIDWFGGLYDLREGLISTPAPAASCLDYGPRTVLRALRFKARFGFELDDDLEDVIRKDGVRLVRKVSPANIAKSLPVFFSAGYSYTGTCILLDYGLFGPMFPLLGSKVNSSDYQEYVKRTAFAVDWIFDEGAVGLPFLAMAAFLWPVVRHLKKEGVEDVEEQVLRSQEEIIKMSHEEREFFFEALHIEEIEDKEKIQEALDEVFTKPTLEDALGVLRIHYWNHPFDFDEE